MQRSTVGVRGMVALVAVLVAGAVVGLGAVAGGERGSVRPRAAVVPSPLAFARSGDRVVSVDVDRAEVAVSARGAVGSIDGRLLFQTVASPDGASLVAVDARTGVERWRQAVDTGLSPIVASQDGGVVVLARKVEGSSASGYPSPRAVTDLSIARRGAEVQAHTLRGNYEPEAFSRDGRRLYLIKYVPAEAPTGYQVRQLDLATGDVSGVESVDIRPGAVMGGSARGRVMAPDGSRLYTLYSVPAGVPDGLHGTDTERGRAFVHILDLEEGWAHCLLLPDPIGVETMASGPMAISPDGGTLAVVDPGFDGMSTGRRSTVVTVATDTLMVGPVHETLGPRWPTAAAVGADGSVYVAGSGGRGQSRVDVIDADAGTVLRGWTTRTYVQAMSAQPGGSLLLAEPERARVVVLRPGREGGRSIALPGEGLVSVGPAGITLPDPRDVLECAC